MVSAPEIEHELSKFIVDNFLFGDAAAAPTATEPLVRSGLVDSTGILEIVTYLDTRYGVRAADDELIAENFESIAAIAQFVLTKRA